MSFKNVGSMNLAGAQAVVYSIDGGTNFRWAQVIGDAALTSITNYVDPALAIEAAWAWLNTQGGGVLRTRGPGETWTTATQINSQGDNVAWHSDWSLHIVAPTDLNDDLISIEHNHVFLFDIYGDGNESNQSGGVNGAVIAVTAGCDNTKVIRCKCVEGYHYGIRAWDFTRLEIADCYMSGNQWNGMNVGAGATGSSRANIHHNEVEESSDVGIAFVGKIEHFTANNNQIHHIDNDEGSVNSHAGVSCEARTAGAPSHGAINDNVISDCTGRGVLFTRIDGVTTIEDIMVEGNTIENGGSGVGGGLTNNVQVNDNKIKTMTDPAIEFLATNTNLQVDGNNIRDIADNGIEVLCTAQIANNHLFNITGGHGIYVNGSRDNGSISGGSIDTVSDTNKDGILIDAGTDWVVGGAIRIRNCDRSGIRIGTGGGGDDICLTGGHISECASGVVIRDGDDILIEGWRIRVTGEAIDINHANCVRTKIGRDNILEGSGTMIAWAAATDPIFPSVPFQFTDVTGGSAVVQVASPVGCYVSDAGGTAIAWGQLPDDVQLILQLKVWAVAKDAPFAAGGQMHCEFTFNAGSSNANYATAATSWGVVNKDSEETDYVADDVIHWVLTDTDTGDSEVSALIAGDSFELLAIYEGAADPDGETDAKFRVVEVEYV